MADIHIKADTMGERVAAAAWAAFREGKTSTINDDHGTIAVIAPPKMASRLLSLNRAGLLADLIRAVERSNKQSGVKLRYYPFGTDTDKPAEYILRAFTHEGGGFLLEDEDVRDAYVWCSGIFEHWFKVEELLDALDNATTVRHGPDKPMAVIEWPNKEGR